MSLRYGKASRGSAPKPSNVLAVFDWSVEVLDQLVDGVRPLYGRDQHPGLWLTERGGRVTTMQISERFAVHCDAVGLELTCHSLRHRYVTHLIEGGFDELFVRMQVGHRFASTTARYTGVSGEYKNQARRTALRGHSWALRLEEEA